MPQGIGVSLSLFLFFLLLSFFFHPFLGTLFS